MQTEEMRSTEFWGICCEGGKKYSQVVRQRFHMTMAALDPTVIPTSPIVSLMVDRGGCEYLLCSLKPGSILQVNLNLYFDKGERVTFSLRGNGKIHLSGYHIHGKLEVLQPEIAKSSESNKMTGREMSSSPKKVPVAQKIQVVKPDSPKKEVNSPKVIKKEVVAQVTVDDSESSSESESEEEKPAKMNTKTTSPKKSTQNLKESPKKAENDEDSDDDDDIFDELDDEESEEEDEKGLKKDGKKLQTYKRLWSSLTQSDDEEDTDSSDSDEDDDKDTSKKPVKAGQQTKKLKNAASAPVPVKKIVKETPKKNVEVNAVSVKKTPKPNDDLNSSVGRTPMPKKKTPKPGVNEMSIDNSSKVPKLSLSKDSDSSDSDDNTNAKNTSMNTSINEKKDLNDSTSLSASKKKKKKKKKSGELNANNASDVGVGNAEKTGLPSASYSKKLTDGLFYEDIRSGNGPVAKKGKLVHVYYTGMLENNKVFDSCKQGKKPFSFKLGTGQVIKGWDMGIEGMQVGGKRRIKIHPNLGYKNQKMGPIPPSSTLYFTVELKAVS